MIVRISWELIVILVSLWKVRDRVFVLGEVPLSRF